MEIKNDFGVLYGQKTTEDSLLIYSSYEDSKASAQTGDFIVLAPRDEGGNKYLARVEAEIYDEAPLFRSRDKTLVAVHYARIAERELSDRDKQKMFSYTYKVKILGVFTNDGNVFSTAVRRLPLVSYHARHLTPCEFENIINGTNMGGKPIGQLCIGDNIQLGDKNVLFDVNKLKAKRTMVFAQSGFGKTNLVKVLLGSAINDINVGKLVFDLEGEYIFKSTDNYGLADIDFKAYRENIIAFTDKVISNAYSGKVCIQGTVKIDLAKDFEIGDLVQTAIDITGAGRTFLEYLDSLHTKTDVRTFLGMIVNNEDSTKIRRFAYTKFNPYFKSSKSKRNVSDDLEANVDYATKTMLGGVIRQIRSYAGAHESGSKLVDKCITALSKGKTVILDMSLKDSIEANIISTILVKRLFENNKSAHTNQHDPVKCIIFVEEAQNVLSKEFVKSSANPFVKVAKQGRKFDIGLVAITQRPSAISEEIRSQAENYFVMHMSNSKDIKALVDSNMNYSGVISRFIQSETISGNMYMVSTNQTFAVPVRVRWFEKVVHKHVYEGHRFTKDEKPELYRD